MRLIKSPGPLTALSAKCYIKHKAISLEDEFYRTFVNEKINKVLSRISNIKNDHPVQPATLDLMSKYGRYIHILTGIGPYSGVVLLLDFTARGIFSDV